MSKTKFFYTQFNHPKGPVVSFDIEHHPSLTQQSFGYECDINNIVQGCVSSLPSSGVQPRYGDFTNLTSDKLSESLNLVADARSKFEQLPSNIRAEFDNNPLKLLQFLDNPKNYDRAVELGLVEKKLTTEVVTQPVSTGEVPSFQNGTSAQTPLDSIVRTDTPQTT